MFLCPNALFFRFRRRLRADLAIAAEFASALLSSASALLLYSPQGGPMQYNGFGGVWTDDGWVTELRVTFEVPEAIRIERIKAWINGPGTADFAVNPTSDDWDVPLSRTFPVDQVRGSPAKWQGVSSLCWDLQPGTYPLFIDAPTVPYGYGYHGPMPNLDSLLLVTDYRDLSDPTNRFPPPFGLAVYGSPLSAVPESSLYGLLGSTGLFALAACRRFQRKIWRRRAETSAAGAQGRNFPEH